MSPGISPPLELFVKSALAWLSVFAVLIAVFVHYGHSVPQTKLFAAPSSQEADSGDSPSPASSPENQKMVTMVSPLPQWMEDGNSAKSVPEVRYAGKPHPNDLIAPSPVGSSTLIVHKTSAISRAVNFPFEIPDHAVNAQLRGSYRSFGGQGIQDGNQSADVAFLLMNEAQYALFLTGRSPDVLLNLDPSHDQDVNFGLPASRELPVKYYLVFVNNPKEGKKIVQADFRVDF
jgi:hypothetical protein